MNSNEWRCAVFTWAAVTAVLIPVWPADASAQTDAARIEAAVASLEWRNIGPTIMGGRVSDLAVVESDPATFYVGTATGGVWKTVNHGTTFESVFEDQPTQSVGDVTVAPSNPNVVWVGSGEPQNRQSSPWGNGVYRSTDAGRSWRHMGLEETHHISRIRIHPRDP
ncbi:MAG: glycosyl hydrolase, partial [Gammaproteobacteria bacterium]|nr:glycosyl hydrolase [Gammaproteobacteria bacterium]